MTCLLAAVSADRTCGGARLAVADGALGFWQAIEEVWPKTHGQRCWVAQDRQRAEQVPDRYLLAQGEAAVPSFDWWRGFHSAELIRLMEEAQTANFDIAVAIGNILQADAQVRTAGAALLPDASITTNVTRSKSATLSTSST